MKTRIQALVVRDKRTNKVMSVEGITDMYSEVVVEYCEDDITLEDLKEWVTSVFGKDSANDPNNWYIKKFTENHIVHIQGEAKDLPSIGNVLVSIEGKDIDWE